MRKLICALLALFFAAFPAFAENLIVNGDFSMLDEDSAPVGWYEDAYIPFYTGFSIEDTETGGKCAVISNHMENDARFVQEVCVKENTVYKFSARIKCEGANLITSLGEPASGAAISIIDTHVHSQSVFDSEGEWKDIVLYARTVPGQTRLKVAARLGGYSSDNVGKAYFTDFKMEEVELATLLQFGILPQLLNTISPDAGQEEISDWGSVDSQITQSEKPPERYTETHIALIIFTVLFFLYLIKFAKNKNQLSESSAQKENGLVSLALLLFLGFAVRCILALRFRGYSIDITNFMLWGDSFFKAGPAFYTQTGLHDYPPLYMLILGISDVIRSVFGVSFNSVTHAFIIKLTPVFADLLLAAGAFFLARKVFSARSALLLSAFILLNPAFLINSAAWGQVDSVLSLAVCLCLYFAVRGRWKIALPVFAVSMLLKPQAMLFGPLGLLALIYDGIRRRKDKNALSGMLQGLLIAFGILYFSSFPFAVYEAHASGKGLLSAIVYPFPWLVNLYSDTTSGYSCITINALNLYQLFNLNWVSTSLKPAFNTFAWIMMGAGYVYSGILLIFSKTKKSLPLAGAVLIAVIFCFGPMMHERYLFPVLPLLLYAYVLHKDKRLIALFLTFTVTLYLNQALVLQCGMTKGFEYMGHLSSEEATLNKLLSCVNLFAVLYLLIVAFEILILKKTKEFKHAKPQSAIQKTPFEKHDFSMHLTKRDYIIMSAVTAAYAVFAFINLGTLKAPETCYKNTEYKEQVVFDLGQTETFRMTYYGGISSVPFTVAFSNDGETWTEENYAQYGEGEIFRWHWYAPKRYADGVYSDAVAPFSGFDLPERENVAASGNEPVQGDAYVNYPTSTDAYPLQTARFVRITCHGIGLPLHEVGFWNVKSETLYPVRRVYGTVENAAYENLIDEQNTVAFTPSYLNGMYFDEIYHARTAYEFIHELPVHEWSHPHLGKILIMLGIEIFGMNPFGWRFMGTLFGALMLPVMYLLVKQLTKKTPLSLIGMLFLAFDSMHFTQSRIATVDTYAVFFIMLMYLFMFRYLKMNLHTDKLSKTLVPLGLSGLSFALACASKWIGIYAGAGLAVLFFASVFVRFREYLNARKLLKAAGIQHHASDELSASVGLFPARLVLTLLFCVLMFIIVPVLIYFLTYYWHFAPEDKFNLRTVWDMQKQIFGYHNGLAGDTHFFRSPWYEWPLIRRPMWYYSADTAYTGYGVVSSISCMGNPIVWWTGAAAITVVIFLPAVTKKTSKTALMISVGFLSQYLPWILISRSTFIYHYFASVPFIILATCYLLGKLLKKDKYAFFTLSATLCALAFFLFAAFYPLESGLECAYDYALHLRWFNWYNFALQVPPV